MHVDKSRQSRTDNPPARRTLQKKTVTAQLDDQRPKTITQARRQAMVSGSPQVKQLQARQDMMTNSPRVQEVAQRKVNPNGLPEQLKTGVENLSGIAMDDVRVHYNSPKPAQLQAHAYAQGTDIHLAPGQEKHLPHEAWHVVQQKQGRVRPTMQLKGKVDINDEVGLEREADVMGGQALKAGDSKDTLQPAGINRPVAQRKIVIGDAAFGRQHIHILEDLQNLERIWGMQVALTEPEQQLLRILLQDELTYTWPTLADLLTTIKTITGTLQFPSEEPMTRQLGVSAEMYADLLRRHQDWTVGEHPDMRPAMMDINRRGYFVERVLSSGSTRPWVLRDVLSSRRKVLKFGGKDPMHIRSEVLSNHLYGAVGAPVMSTSLIQAGGKEGLFEQFIEDLHIPRLMNLAVSEDFRRHIAMDFLMGNWDIVKLDNWMHYRGRYYRLDNGGALIFRAQGERKSPREWSPETITEMDPHVKSMVNSRSKDQNPYHGIEDGAVAVSAYYLLNHLSPGRLDEAIKLAGVRLEEILERSGFTASHAQLSLRHIHELAVQIRGILLSRLSILRAFAQQRLPYECIQIHHAADVQSIALPQMPKSQMEQSADPVVEQVRRMRGGFLTRRLGDEEKTAFTKAAASASQAELKNLLFAKRPAGKEVVFGLNYKHIFKKEGERKEHDYSVILEIPVTERLLAYLAEEAHFQADNPPRPGKVPTNNSPRLKPESEHRGLDQEDIPNLLIKESEFPRFWSTLTELRLIAEGEHLNLRPEEELAEIKKREEQERARLRWEQKERKRKADEARAAATARPSTVEKDDEEDYGFDVFK